LNEGMGKGRRINGGFKRPLKPYQKFPVQRREFPARHQLFGDQGANPKQGRSAKLGLLHGE
jgi:hypothetical protein